MGADPTPRRNARRDARDRPRSQMSSITTTINRDKLHKEFDAHNHPKKLEINALFAETVVQYLGTDVKVIILDTWRGITSKQLIKGGLDPKQITAPNINFFDCYRLKNLGVNSPHRKIDDCVVYRRFDVAWYDSMTNLCGNKEEDNYVGLFAHHFFARNHGRSCILAITISSRSNEPACNYMKQRKLMSRQINALIAWHGLEWREEFQYWYGQKQAFGLWIVGPTDDVIPKQKLMTWRGSKRLIGFPEGFTEAGL